VYLTKEILEVFGYFNIGGQVIHNVKCSDDSAFLAKKNRRWNWKSCGTGMNVGDNINPLKAELNPICHLLALLGAHIFPR
jgi:hypothetical protein